MPEQKAKGRPTKLVITECLLGYTGYNSRNEEYHIYNIKACKPDGEVLDVDLNSFEDIPTGEQDLIVTKYVRKKEGKPDKTSYTLARKKAPTGKRLDDIETRLDKVEGYLRERHDRQHDTSPTPAEPSPMPAKAPPGVVVTDGSPEAEQAVIEREAARAEQFGDEPPY